MVPDFSSRAGRAVFEARTLFFLGSWLENAGAAARRFPLHLVCIGEPPESVRRLAERGGAAIHVRETLRSGQSVTVNKLRGLELGDGGPGRTLLVDADVFVLGDFSALAADVPAGIAAAPAGSKWVTEAHWQKIYAELSLPASTERTPALTYELGLVPPDKVLHREHGDTTDLRRVLPYHNTGVLLVPRAGGLRELWAEHHQRVRRLFEPEPETRPNGLAARLLNGARRLGTRRRKISHTVTTCDQAAFASAVEVLRGQGMPFQRLPDPYHARWLHCRAGVLGFDEMKIFHATGFLRGWRGGRRALEASVGEYVRDWQENLRLGAPRRTQPEQAEADAGRAGETMWALYHKYVLPAVE